MTRDEIVALITAAAVAELGWRWDETPYVPSPQKTIQHVSEAIYEAIEHLLAVEP